MTVAVATGICLQGLAVFIVHLAVHGQWIRHTGALLLLVATAYHGLTEVVQAIFPGRNHFYRDLVSQESIDRWVVLVSMAMLIYAVVYAAALGRRVPSEQLRTPPTSQLSLRLVLALAVPLALLAMAGAAFQDTTAQTQNSDGYLVSGLVVQFLVLILAVAGALAIVRFGPNWVLPILAAEAVVLATVGARTTVVAGCVMVLYGAALAGVRLPRNQLAAAVAVVALLGMVISSTRAVAGREAFQSDQGASTRITALIDGAAALPSGAGVDAVLDDFVYRLDGNTFGALVLESLDRGAQPVGTVTIVDGLVRAVPSGLYPGKLEQPLIHRSEKAFFVSRFWSLPSFRDLLPGWFPTMLGYGGVGWLLVLSGLLGLALARLDHWLLRTESPLVFLLALGVAQTFMFYEQGPTTLFISARGVLLLIAALAAGRWLLRKQQGLLDGHDVPDELGRRGER